MRLITAALFVVLSGCSSVAHRSVIAQENADLPALGGEPANDDKPHFSGMVITGITVILVPVAAYYFIKGDTNPDARASPTKRY